MHTGIQPGIQEGLSNNESSAKVPKAKRAFYAMTLLSVVLFCFIVGASGCIGERVPVSQEGEVNFTLIPEKTRVTEGEIFDIGLFLKNTGNTTLNVWKMKEQVSYHVFFLYPNGSYVPYEGGVIERVHLKNDALVELQPGQSLEARQDSNCWTLLPGEYTFYAEYHTSAGERITKPYWVGRAHSNNVSIFVEAENNSILPDILSDSVSDSLPESGSSPEKGAVEDLNVPEAPVSVAVSYELIYLSPEELAEKSDLILTGSVKEILPARWNTSEGEQPENAIGALGLDNVIYRDVVISVDESLKGAPPSNDVLVRVLGGTVGDFGMDVEDEASFEPGEAVLLYLVEDTSPATKDLGPEHFRVTGVSQGKYTLTGDGKAVKFGETADLEDLLKIIDEGEQS